MEWNEYRMKWKIIKKFYEEKNVYETTVTEHKWVKKFYYEEVEWSIPFKHVG